MVVGRYELHAELASGGMAVVHLGRLRGDAGFARTVAIKRLHRHYVGDPELSALLLDEARLASRLLHPNIVAPQDLVTSNGEIFVVMEYVHGLTLAALVREAKARNEMVPVGVVARIMSDLLAGLHAAHEARDAQGRALALVHRDVSPQNVMVGADGLARVLDFGIAQAAFRSQTTREGQLRAKLAYAAPEHVRDQPIDRRADVYSAAIVCWELLTLERLFSASNESALLARVLEQAPQPASKFRTDTPAELDMLLLAALSKDPAGRPASAEEFALAIERAAPPATHRDVARWVSSLGGEPLERLSARLADVDSGILPQETPKALVATVDTRTSELGLTRVDTTPTASGPSGQGKRRRRGRAVTLAVGVAAAALVMGPVLLARRVTAGSPPSPAVSPAAVADTPVAAALSASSERETPSPTSYTVPGPSAPEPPAPRGEKKPALVGSRPATKPRPAPVSDDCSELTEIDAKGIRRVKRQCLR
jgi:serine/threonine-protein kinase